MPPGALEEAQAERSKAIAAALKNGEKPPEDFDPSLLHRLYDGTLEMTCPLPTGYKPRMNWWATELRARVNEHWHLFEISEQSNGVSGGWMASCIPPPMYRIFLTAWLQHAGQKQITAPAFVGQLELF